MNALKHFIGPTHPPTLHTQLDNALGWVGPRISQILFGIISQLFFLIIIINLINFGGALILHTIRIEWLLIATEQCYELAPSLACTILSGLKTPNQTLAFHLRLFMEHQDWRGWREQVMARWRLKFLPPWLGCSKKTSTFVPIPWLPFGSTTTHTFQTPYEHKDFSLHISISSVLSKKLK